MSAFHYYQIKGGEEHWQPVPVSHRDKVLAELKPMFMTVLSVSKLVDDLSYEEKLKLAYMGPFYADFDSEDEALVIEKVNEYLDKLEALDVNLGMCRLFATGGRGYHVEVPVELFMEKVPKTGVIGLPSVYREMALALAVDTLDLKIYSTGRGRMWRQPNVERSTGRCKVPVTVEEMRQMTPELAVALTSAPRADVAVLVPEFCVKLSIEYSKACQKVEELLKKRARFKPNPADRDRANSASIQYMMAGLGIKASAGFQEIATQLAIAAVTAGMSEDKFVVECDGLIQNHQGDSKRYGSPAKRAEELRRMHRYMDGNQCYEFSVGAIKTLMNHAAPDLDGIAATMEEVKQEIEAAAAQQEDPNQQQDEYEDVARGVTLSKYGVYMDTEFGKKRICAVSFDAAQILVSSETSQIIGYDAIVLVNGRTTGNVTLELDMFSGLVPFNRFVSKYGHAFQGTDAQVRTVMMRFVEQAKKKGNMSYVVTREGLDMVTIPHHENERFREPFLVWSDSHGVHLEPEVEEMGLKVKFAGFPDPRGMFKTDISSAPSLGSWLREPGNRELMRDTLANLLACQRPEVLGKVLGWYTACFWKQLFQKHYGKFPLLHINGPAGMGKCLAKDTPVLMADGTVKMVQDVLVGDQLLGPDGTVRNVLSLARGRDQMYRVTPVKGDPYTVNSAHILSLRKSGAAYGLKLSDGTYVPADADVVNVNVEVFARSSTTVKKDLKGWRSGAVEFDRSAEALQIEPYALGVWLGDGKHTEPSICKPEGVVSAWWKEYAERLGCTVSKYKYADDECPSWSITSGRNGLPNPLTGMLRQYDLLGNKHIPDAYKFAPLQRRLELLAGLIDTDGHLTSNTYEWVTKSESMAQDFAFICRSAGLACYVTSVRKGIKSSGFSGSYWKCLVSGDIDKIPCLAKKASPRQQIKRATVTGISVEPVGEGEYFGFELDGDRLFLLGDFTVTHNTEMQLGIGQLFYWRNEPRPLSPGSTNFALLQHLMASSSIPLILDEYKPHVMQKVRVDALKGLFRDAYNQRDQARGGGSRESDDYRVLQFSQMAAPMVFIAEAAEEEAAVMERVVLVTLARPAQSRGLKNHAHWQAFWRNRHLLGILGQYLAMSILEAGSASKFVEEFDQMYNDAKRRFMLSEEDLRAGLSEEELKDKQNTKERPVFNHTVARFGFRQLRNLINEAIGPELDGLMAEMEDGVFARLHDLHAATTPEYVKVLSEIVSMSHHVEADRPDAIRKGHEYAFSTVGGREVIELAIRPAYQRYRMHCRQTGLEALFGGVESFMHAMGDCPAFIKRGTGDVLQAPGIFMFDAHELARLGVDTFKN